ncbi:MAG TPA: hypothetical protein ENK24_08475 [Anaerolineae bacterium]|nr:hypothetical protein [Anaerolineae bacterium]
MKQKIALFLSVFIVAGLLIVPLALAQDPAFDATAAEEEGYWYSRYNLGNLVMRSGLGETFMPEMEMVQKMVQMVDANPDDGDTAVPPMNASLLKSVYASGDPHYFNKFNVDDYGSQRWDPATFDTTVTTRAMGWTIIKETEWAKQFHVDNHFGTVNDNFGAQQRFAGMVLNAESKMQLQYAAQMLKNDQGLYANSDGVVDYGGNWVMLAAFSDAGALAMMENVPHSASNRYRDDKASMMFLNAADMLYTALANRAPEGVDETSLAVQGLTWFAAHATNADHQAAALAKISMLGDSLAAGSYATAADQASAIRGLLEAYRVSGNSAYLDAAAANFSALSGSYDAANGVFSSQNVYSIDNVAVIMGALNSLKLFAGDSVDQSAVENIFTGFYESAVNKSGLQLSAPPIPVAKGAFEQNEPPIFYSYPGMPAPPMAGGEFGVAPVFGTEITWDGSQWSLSNARFDAAGAMHASNEFIWFHNDEVDGFPVIKENAMMADAAPAMAAAPAALPETGAENNALAQLPLLLAIAGLLLVGGGFIALRHFAAIK